MTNGSLMKVKSIAEFSLLEHSAILLTCIKPLFLHKAIISLENQFMVFLRVAVLHKFYCNKKVNNKGAEQTARNHMQICSFDVRLQKHQLFLHGGPYLHY